MRPHHIPALTLTTWLLLGALSPSEAAAQVNVVLSCPPYNAVTGEGNNPAMPQDPQVTPMDVSGARPILCQVLYGNTSGAAVNNVRFTLRAAALAIRTRRRSRCRAEIRCWRRRTRWTTRSCGRSSRLS